MKYISKAPFRLGLAGGGTDVSPYTETYGGNVLNSTVDLYATAILIPRDDDKIIMHTIGGTEKKVELDAKDVLDYIPKLDLHIGVYNHIVKNFSKKPLAFELITTIDVPPGSGLGTSSTLVVAIIGAFMEWLKLPLGEYDIAQMAVTIERKEMNMVGGRQDQYAATFGGFNFMEFYEHERVIVNPLRVKSNLIRELNYHLLLFYTKTQRNSSGIIDIQRTNFTNQVPEVIKATHHLKEQTVKMKEALLKGQLSDIGELLNESWRNKKMLADGISNQRVDDIYQAAIGAGALGGKISGAGGGGFMIFYCPGNSRFNVINQLSALGVEHQRYHFHYKGLETWTSKQ